MLKDIKSLQNRLLKVCYVPATSAGLPRVKLLLFFSFFVVVAISSTNKANKQAVHAVKQSIFLDVNGYAPYCMPLLCAAYKVLISGKQIVENYACCQGCLLHGTNASCCQCFRQHDTYPKTIFMKTQILL